MTFYTHAPIEVLTMIYEYAQHMSRIDWCEDLSAGCLCGFLWTLPPIPEDETMFRERALAYAMDHVSAGWARLTPKDGADVMMVILTDRVNTWCAERASEIYGYMVNSYSPMQTAYKMQAWAGLDNWDLAVDQGNLFLAVGEVWDELIIPAEVRNHHMDFVSVWYHEAVEECLMEDADRQYTQIVLGDDFLIRLPLVELATLGASD